MLQTLLIFLLGSSIFSFLNVVICHAKVSIRYPAIEALGGCTALLCVHQWGIHWRALIAFSFLAVLTAIAFTDIDTMNIPDSLIITAGLTGLLSIPFFPVPGLTERIIGIFSVSVILLILALIIPNGFGGGDIKLMAACGLFLGWRQSFTAFILAALAAGGYCILMLAAGKMERKSRLSFGAFLCLGMAVTLFI